MAGSSTTQLSSLIARMQAGDPLARQELVGRACDRLLRLTHRLCQDFPRLARWEQPDDVAQNAAIRLLRSLQSVTPDDVRGFLTLAAREIRRELLDLSRHHFGPEGAGAAHASIAAVEAPSRDFSPPQSTLDPQRLANWTEFHRHADELPEEERVVFDLLWYHELTQDEAAAALGISLATLKRRWMAARIRLQGLLGHIPGLA